GHLRRGDLHQMGFAVEDALKELGPGPRPLIHFQGLFHSQDSIMVSGFPAIEKPERVNRYFEIMQKIVVNCMEAGLEIKPAWGMHSTISRVIKNIPAEKVKELCNFLNGLAKHNFSYIELARIIVGSHTTSPEEGLKLHPFATFDL
ncbi:MAG: hypothetical protein ABIG60_01775, partial [Patescibacteria group bacterium]